VDAELCLRDCFQRRIVVPNDVTHGDAEIRHLRSSINDLISLQTLPAIWDGREPGSLVISLLAVLVNMLRLDFAYVRLNDSFNESPTEFVQFSQRHAPPPQASEIGRALGQWLTNNSVDAPLAVPDPAGNGQIKIAPFRLGLTDEIGMLVAGSKRADFPTPTETLLLRMAGNQALVALQEARRLHEQQRAAEELERRVADRTAQLTAANEALRESEKKYRTLFDSIDEGFCTIEMMFDENDCPVDYRFLEVNPSFELVLQRVHPEDRDLVKQTIQRASQAGTDFDFEHRLLMPDGSVKHLHVVAHAERDASSALELVGAVMDVTVAMESADKIRLIINTVPGLLWTARLDGWVDFLNQRWLDYTGMTLEQGLGWAWQPGYHPNDLGNPSARLEALALDLAKAGAAMETINWLHSWPARFPPRPRARRCASRAESCAPFFEKEV